jgi:hypothetical protein
VMTSEPQDAAHHHEAVGLETAHLRSAQIIALALASQPPAVALATVPFLIMLPLQCEPIDHPRIIAT